MSAFGQHFRGSTTDWIRDRLALAAVWPKNAPTAPAPIEPVEKPHG